MLRIPEREAIGKLLALVGAATTLAILPGSSYDPINVPKLALLSLGGFTSIFFLLISLRTLKEAKFKAPLIAVMAFILDLVLVLIFSGSNFNQEFFGADGRSTGFVAYAALSGLFLAAVITASSFSLTRVSYSLLATGLISTLYGILQILGADPVGWVNSYSPVIGFLGNPDFQSSFVALSAILAAAMILNKDSKISFRIAYVIYVLGSLYVIKETKAQQGFLVFIAGVGIISIAYLYIKRKKIWALALSITAFLGAVLIVFGTVKKGPLATILYKDSVTYRGDYWHAGWKMTRDNPFLGVGLDSYGDWYRRARTLEATLRRGPDAISNAAHNVLLDFSSNGGFPLLFIYLTILVLALRASVLVIARSTRFDPVFVGLFAVWIGYQAQSIISLNQLGLAVWGWIISGLLIGWEIQGRDNAPEPKPFKKSKKIKTASEIASNKVQPSTVLTLTAGLLIGAIIGMPPLLASIKYRSALESNNLTNVSQTETIFPQSANRTVLAATILDQNKWDSDALLVTQKAVARYPDFFEGWKLLSTLKNATPAQVAEAKLQMKRLDPHNPDLK